MSGQVVLSRRRILKAAGAAAAVAASPLRLTGAAELGITGRLAQYMVSAGTIPLPEATQLACKHRILDTFAAMVSGARMRPGRTAVKYVRETHCYSAGHEPEPVVERGRQREMRAT